MHRRWLLAAGISAALVAGLSTNAHAEDANGFGKKGQLIISADRLLPVLSYTSAKLDLDDNTTVSQHGTSLALLWGDEASNVDGSVRVHTVPRASIDFTVIDRLTLGGSIAFAFGLGGSTTTTTTVNGTETKREVDSPTSTLIGFAPRVGYILPLGNMFAFWPRGGFAFYSVSSKTTDPQNDNNTDTTTNTLFSLDLDPQFALVPMEHFFFTFGPTVNIPLTGNSSFEQVRGNVTSTRDRDLTVFHVGINAGLGGWFDL